MRARTLLLNWVYYHPVGHAVEAFKTAKGLWNANENIEIHLLLNSRTPVELAGACDWITRAYPIDVDEFRETEVEDAACLRDLPATWDFVVTDHRVTTSPFPFADPLRNFHNVAARRFEARQWNGGQHLLTRAPGAPGYQPNATIRMRVPEFARDFVERLNPGRANIAVLPGGSSPEPIYPSAAWWKLALSTLGSEFRDAHFFVTGKSRADHQSSTARFSGAAIDGLTSASARIFNCYDIGIWNQLALLEWCDLLVAPHTGFAFLAPSVGTPWLSISGARWPECYFNDVPFYCVLPECEKYPCWMEMLSGCVQDLAASRTVPCMGEELQGRIPDLVNGARLLLSDGFSFEKATALHQSRIDERFPRERFFQIV
jgi:hypothetical protein